MWGVVGKLNNVSTSAVSIHSLTGVPLTIQAYCDHWCSCFCCCWCRLPKPQMVTQITSCIVSRMVATHKCPVLVVQLIARPPVSWYGRGSCTCTAKVQISGYLCLVCRLAQGWLVCRSGRSVCRLGWYVHQAGRYVGRTGRYLGRASP